MEIEVPVTQPRIFSRKIRRHHRPVLELETVLFTMFYPCKPNSGRGPAPDGSRNWSRETWLPRPRLSIAYGYGHFGGVGFLAVPITAATCMFTKLPAWRNAPLAESWPTAELNFENKGKSGDEPQTTNRERPRFPLLIFSHGLGGCRSMYSSMCGEFASYGFVCVAVEHRDGSSPRTYVNHSYRGEGSFEEIENRSEIQHLPRQKKKGFDRVDYLFPLGNPHDTSPNNDKGVDRELREAQVDFRSAEIEEAYKVIQKITNGEGKTVARRNLRRKGHIGSSSRGLDGVDWNSWEGRVEMNGITIAGHSFGAATTVNIMRSRDRFPWVSQGIIYDIWGAGIKVPPQDGGSRINLPLLAINSEAFSYWNQNFELVKDLVQETLDSGSISWLLTVRGTVHVNQSDFSIVFPKVCEVVLKMTADPQRALDLNINASLEFLGLTLPSHLARFTLGAQKEHILESTVVPLKQIPKSELHRPREQWLAARLSIRHELSYHFNPVRRFKRQREHREMRDRVRRGEVAPHEIWMHVAPPDTTLEKHGVIIVRDMTVTSSQRTSEFRRLSGSCALHQQPKCGNCVKSPPSH